MTKGMREFFNLPSIDTEIENPMEENPSEEDMEIDLDVDSDKIIQSKEFMKDVEKRMQMLDGTDHSKSMDELHGEIVTHARDLMQFGYNADLRSARGIFEVATSMYGHAISAKNAKRDAQLKAIKLALDKEKVDLDKRKAEFAMEKTKTIVTTGDGTNQVIVESRNDILRRLANLNDDTK